MKLIKLKESKGYTKLSTIRIDTRSMYVGVRAMEMLKLQHKDKVKFGIKDGILYIANSSIFNDGHHVLKLGSGGGYIKFGVSKIDDSITKGTYLIQKSFIVEDDLMWHKLILHNT